MRSTLRAPVLRRQLRRLAALSTQGAPRFRHALLPGRQRGGSRPSGLDRHQHGPLRLHVAAPLCLVEADRHFRRVQPWAGFGRRRRRHTDCHESRHSDNYAKGAKWHLGISEKDFTGRPEMYSLLFESNHGGVVWWYSSGIRSETETGLGSGQRRGNAAPGQPGFRPASLNHLVRYLDDLYTTRGPSAGRLGSSSAVLRI